MFTIMGIGNKIYSSIMCVQLFNIISKHGVKCQFGSTPGVVCQDGTFNIKKLVYIRHNHNLPTYVALSYLVKSFDTSNHALLIAMLGKYGAPPRLRSAIKSMYDKSIVKIIIAKVDTSIDFKVGVKQGEIMDPVLFLLLMMAFAKTLEDEWTALVLSKAQFARKDNSPRSTGQLVSHRPGTLLSGILFYLFCMLYIDDGTFFFESRTDIEKGSTLLSDHFARFGLEIHIGTGKNPQTLNVYFSRPQVFLIHEHYFSLLSPPPPCPYRRNKVIKRDAHVRTKNISSAVKQKSSR